MVARSALKIALVASSLMALPSVAMADFTPIKTKSEFVKKITGKQLTMVGIKVKVSPDGRIAGRAMGWDVDGEWKWSGGYFCRNLSWGGDDIGYNCQEVSVNGNKVRFQSDKGTGQSADLRIR